MKNAKKVNEKAKISWEILNKLMIEKGITGYKMAKDLGWKSAVLFTDWKNGKSMPKIDKIKQIADYLGVTPEYILGIEDTKKEILESLPEEEPIEEISDDEKEIISCYRKLTDEQKVKFRSILLSMLLED